MISELHISKWNNIHAVVMLLTLVPVVIFKSVALLSILCFLSFLWFIVISAPFLRSYKPFAGYANWITFARLCCAVIMGLSYPLLDDMYIAASAMIIVSMDGLDGYLARKFNVSSRWGAYLDMETDSFYVCLMATMIYLRNYLDSWILFIGYMRYMYVVLLIITGYDMTDEQRSRITQIIAGVLFWALITPFVLDKPLYLPLMATSSFLLILSFSYSFIRLYRHSKS